MDIKYLRMVVCVCVCVCIERESVTFSINISSHSGGCGDSQLTLILKVMKNYEIVSNSVIFDYH